jgi:hypothetical protein
MPSGDEKRYFPVGRADKALLLGKLGFRVAGIGDEIRACAGAPRDVVDGEDPPRDLVVGDPADALCVVTVLLKERVPFTVKWESHGGCVLIAGPSLSERRAFWEVVGPLHRVRLENNRLSAKGEQTSNGADPTDVVGYQYHSIQGPCRRIQLPVRATVGDLRNAAAGELHGVWIGPEDVSDNLWVSDQGWATNIHERPREKQPEDFPNQLDDDTVLDPDKEYHLHLNLLVGGGDQGGSSY